MKKQTVRGVLKTCASGGMEWAGYLESEKQEVPEGLTESPVDVLTDDDGYAWVLAFPEPIVALGLGDLLDIKETEIVRAAKAKLTDEELTALGHTRED